MEVTRIPTIASGANAPRDLAEPIVIKSRIHVSLQLLFPIILIHQLQPMESAMAGTLQLPRNGPSLNPPPSMKASTASGDSSPRRGKPSKSKLPIQVFPVKMRAAVSSKWNIWRIKQRQELGFAATSLKGPSFRRIISYFYGFAPTPNSSQGIWASSSDIVRSP